jgi:predicted TIM-barrel fold metal-dependent hydrolase
MSGFRFIVLALVIVAASSCDREPREPQPIIDMHLHADLDLTRRPAGTPGGCIPQPCSSALSAALTGDEALKATLEAMDRHHIVKAFLSGDNLSTVSAWVAAGDGRFIGAPLVWTPGTPSVEMLRGEYSAKRLAGMGEIATQYSGYAPNDPALEPYFALAEELDLPVLIHTLGVGIPLPQFRSAAGNPLLLESVLVRHPKLRLYVEDAGYPFLEETVAMMSQYPQLYVDVSTITWLIPRDAFHSYLHELIRAGLGKRIMFGSDQTQWPAIDVAVEAIDSAAFLSETEKRDIFYNNAATFLRLSETEIAEHHAN